MTLCPIALLATCSKCLAVGFCPLKEVLGDYKPEAKDGEPYAANRPIPPIRRSIAPSSLTPPGRSGARYCQSVFSRMR